VLAAVIWSVGAMPLFGVRLTILCMILPIVLLAVGSAYTIHPVSHYKDEIADKTFTAEEHRDFVFALTRRLVKPVFLAALTGLAQKKAPVFVVTAIIVVVSIIGSAGVVVDNAMVEFFNPASEVSRGGRFTREHFGSSTQIIVSVEADSTDILLHPDTLSAADGLCAYLSGRVPNVGKVTGFTDMVKRVNQMFNVDESPEGIRPSNRADRADDFAGDRFGFGDFGFDDTEGEASPSFQPRTPVDTVVPSARPYAPSVWSSTTPSAGDTPATPPASAETPITFAMLNAAVGKNANMSANELARELERMANYGGYSYYEIPTDPAKHGKETPEELGRLVANYLVLLAGGADDSFANDPLEPAAFETIALVNSQWQEDTDLVIDEINRYAAANFPKAKPGALPNVRVLVGGGAAQEAAIANLVTSSQVSSILIAVIAVLLILAFSNKSFAAGLAAALPLSITILCNFAVMGFLGITLNMETALIASLAVGIGIDYTIHFIETFKREFQNGGDYLYRTFAGSGKAILINAVSVGASFAVLGFSQLIIVGQFGFLVCLCMGSSALISLTVIPVLLETVRPKFIYGNSGAMR
jgi:predicted RND superfamily exporter protein